MSQPRLARTELLEAAEAELDAAGYAYREEIGGKHPRLIVDVNGREETIVISSTPSDWRAVKNKRAFVRRKIREWQAEAGTVAQSAASAESHHFEGETSVGNIVVAEPANVIFHYGEHPVRHRGEMLSLTDMWKAAGSPSGKRPDYWKKDADRLKFLTHIAETLNAPPECIWVGSRGRGGSTFAHWQIAMAYAQYLSPEFHAWCNSVVRSHMTGEPLEDTPPAPPAVYGDDISALLEVLSDIQSAVIAAIQRSDSHAIDRVEDTKAALLHYLKVQLKEPSLAFFDDVRARNKAAWERDRLLVKELRDMRSDVNRLMAKAEQPLLTRSFVFADWYDHDRIYQEFFPEQIIPNRRFLSQAISKSLDAYCKKRQRGFDMQSRRIGGRNVNLWHKDSVKRWVEVSGRDIVRRHLAKSRRADPVVVAFSGKK